MTAVETQGKGGVLATKAVEAQSKRRCQTSGRDDAAAFFRNLTASPGQSPHGHRHSGERGGDGEGERWSGRETDEEMERERERRRDGGKEKEGEQSGGGVCAWVVVQRPMVGAVQRAG